ncbi:MAG: response regulator [Gammaproteobacteria bacterium]|nr:response regulator [Gammaproteobacteria bacterium]MBU1603641.1 response regulator [Gammaproteobacteria bacterium]MBU2435414.1 response regulator [Gammaproteobacteria bacterium]MBU2449161.1 response regulator [Gammaproteobacteria bacterium]
MTKTLVLLVDDEALNLEILLEYFDGEETFTLQAAESGEAAWQLLQNPEYDFKLILLDRMMPGLDGIGLLKRMKLDARLSTIPVIMQTAANSPEQIREGLEAGAYYYLTKPYRRDSLLAIVHAALSDAEARSSLSRQLHQHINSLQFLDQAEFSIRTIEEAAQLASFIAHACPNPDAAVMGISELLINGVEHGNLGLTYAEKSRLKQDDSWHEEIKRRTALPENFGKEVRLSYRRQADSITLRICDQGNGFPWQNYLEIDPLRAFDPNGRGIALSRMLSFSNITYEGSGNVAVATISRSDTRDGEQQP